MGGEGEGSGGRPGEIYPAGGHSGAGGGGGGGGGGGRYPASGGRYPVTSGSRYPPPSGGGGVDYDDRPPARRPAYSDRYPDEERCVFAASLANNGLLQQLLDSGIHLGPIGTRQPPGILRRTGTGTQPTPLPVEAPCILGLDRALGAAADTPMGKGGGRRLGQNSLFLA